MKVLVVGAGLTGAVIARILAEGGFAVRVIDKREHIAGNAFDFVNAHGIRVHRYGPHLFHTNNARVFAFLSRFTGWLPYRHKAKALLADGRYVPFPVNRQTARAVGGENIIDIFFRPYTRKMWGMELEEMNPAVLRRVPVRADDCEDYFPGDKYQALPDGGYAKMTGGILAHDGIKVQLQTPFDKKMEKDYGKVFNCMPPDEYYDFCFGALPWRSIRFCHEHINIGGDNFAQPAAVVNFTTDDGPTRRTEWRHLPGHDNGGGKMTTMTSEYPCCYTENNHERYYPIKDAAGENRKRYRRYAAIPNAKTTFTGRCGTYAYIDMHQAVNMAMLLARRFVKSAAAEKQKKGERTNG